MQHTEKIEAENLLMRLGACRRCIFEYLTVHGHGTARELAEYAGVAQYLVNYHAGVLERAGLIDIMRSERIHKYSLTRKGSDLAERIEIDLWRSVAARIEARDRIAKLKLKLDYLD